MKVKIYQVNMERDENQVAFMGYDSLAKFQGSPDVDSRIYDKVFEGEVNCFTLEKLYQIFNTEHPAGYKGRSMSVSDVVEIVDGNTGKSYFHFCDSFGFKDITFESNKTQLSERFCNCPRFAFVLRNGNRHLFFHTEELPQTGGTRLCQMGRGKSHQQEISAKPTVRKQADDAECKDWTERQEAQAKS